LIYPLTPCENLALMVRDGARPIFASAATSRNQGLRKAQPPQQMRDHSGGSQCQRNSQFCLRRQ
jgi:hypothetical protein